MSADIKTINNLVSSLWKKYEKWLAAQGERFSPEQVRWLVLIKDNIATNLGIGADDFEYSPFYEMGGPVRAYRLFGEELQELLTEMNEALAA